MSQLWQTGVHCMMIQQVAGAICSNTQLNAFCARKSGTRTYETVYHSTGGLGFQLIIPQAFVT